MELSPPPAGCSLLSSPFSSPNVSALLKIKILSWSQETGFPVCICVRVAGKAFNLHKHPLTSKSGYFREKLRDATTVDLPRDFPGSSETFEMIALFIYGSSTLVDPFNVAALRCAAQFLMMTEEYCARNLSERFDIYLNQVVLQSWNETLIVLRKCQTLLPWAEDLLIVSRCIETLAFMACMEILDPERRRDQPVVTLAALARRPWTDRMAEDVVSRDPWIKDLADLPLGFFRRVVGSLRRQGMREKYVGPIVLFYAEKRVISTTKKLGFGDSVVENLQGVLDLLPPMASGRVVPVGLYLSLLAVAVELGVTNDGVEKLQRQIAGALHLSRVEDFLRPKGGGGEELSVMENIFKMHYLSCNYNNLHVGESDCTTPVGNGYVVAELWDAYLNQIAADSEMSCKRFSGLIETVPVVTRQTHDHLYRAMNTFFQSHPNLTQEEKGSVCKYLNCQKLSQQVCVEAVQNELMPLRFIVQALFVQQLNTQQAFRECSDSFRHTTSHYGDYFSGSISSSTYAISKSQNLGDMSPYINGSELQNNNMSSNTGPLSMLLQRDSSTRVGPELEISRKDYESTSFRIQNLEKELVSLKRSLQMQQQISTTKKKIKKERNGSKKIGTGLEDCGLQGTDMGPVLVERRLMSKKRNHHHPVGQVGGCIWAVNFASQRKYVDRVLKVLQRISLFGRGRSKRQPSLVPQR